MSNSMLINNTEVDLSDLKKSLISKIGDYDIKLPNGVTPDSQVKKHLGDLGTKKLYKVKQDYNTTSTRSRIELINKLIAILGNKSKYFTFKGNDPRPENPEKYAVKLKDLLGKDGVTVYKNAIKEEKNSIEYRNAVFLKAARNYDGHKWNERMIMWVGGPSASGKSFAANAAIKKAGASIMKKNMQNNDGNLVVFVDGGIEREVSQMRQLVLQTALKLGYSGIKDLHENTKLGIKNHVMKAALSAPDMSIVIPNTFSNPLTKYKISQFEEMPNTRQIFCEVSGANNDLKQFKETVYRMGNSRAWKTSFNDIDLLPIKMNNLNIGCESKKYQKEYFDAGLNGTTSAKKFYMKESKENACIQVENDVIFVKKEGNNLIKCTPDEKGAAMKMTARDFAAWNQYIQNPKGTPLEPEVWLQRQPPSPPLIKVNLITAPKALRKSKTIKNNPYRKSWKVQPKKGPKTATNDQEIKITMNRPS